MVRFATFILAFILVFNSWAQEIGRSNTFLSTSIGINFIKSQFHSDNLFDIESTIPMLRISHTYPIFEHKLTIEPFIGYINYRSNESNRESHVVSVNVFETGGLLNVCFGNFQIAPGINCKVVPVFFNNYPAHLSLSVSTGAHFQYNFQNWNIGMEYWNSMNCLDYLEVTSSSEPKTRKNIARIVAGINI